MEATSHEVSWRPVRTRVRLSASGRRATAASVVPPSREGGPAFNGAGDVDYVCGCCAALLCAGVRRGMFASLAFACGCGAVNTIP
jgi:hypothetical protein